MDIVISLPRRKKTYTKIFYHNFIVLFTRCVFCDGNPIHETCSVCVSVWYSYYSADRRNIVNDFPCRDRNKVEKEGIAFIQFPRVTRYTSTKHHAVCGVNQKKRKNVKYMSTVPIHFDLLLCEGIGKKKWIWKYFLRDSISENSNPT